MAFESLTDKLQNVFKNLRKKGRLTEDGSFRGRCKLQGSETVYEGRTGEGCGTGCNVRPESGTDGYQNCK